MMTWNKIIDFAKTGNPMPHSRVDKDLTEWKKELTPEQFRVTRQHGTERPFSGEYCESFDPGIYGCVCCGTPLFDSTEKFESGTGWPSFTQPLKENAIKYIMDSSFGMVRIETLCNTCDAHLGHVFPDGPKPSGLRYCMNSVSLKKISD
ncbi:MAG TPA: peptide-methionine (R)-S-oxide reductase [Bacteroidetes bacterium]|nr:peptide-methionine (R)-S-oxide reductase [Bacteroidota bacterium]